MRSEGAVKKIAFSFRKEVSNMDSSAEEKVMYIMQKGNIYPGFRGVTRDVV